MPPGPASPGKAAIRAPLQRLIRRRSEMGARVGADSESVRRIDSQPGQGQWVVLAAEILAQSRDENLVVGGGMREERHGGAELEVVRMAEDRLDTPPCGLVHQAGARAQARTEDRVLQVGFGLGTGCDGEALCRRTAAESLDLRKHEPHPVTRLAPGAQLRQDLLDDRLLRLDEALEATRGSPPAAERHGG